MRNTVLLLVLGVVVSAFGMAVPGVAGNVPVGTGDYPDGYWDRVGDERLPLIRQMIQEKGLCWKAGPTSVSNLTDEEKQTLLGYIPPETDPSVPDPFPARFSARDLPAVFDWREAYKVSSVTNQGNCGSCWLFGPTAALECAIMIYEDQEFNLAEQQILSCVSFGWGCGGGWPQNAYDHFRSYGAIEEACMPYLAMDFIPCTEDECEPVTVLDNYYSVSNDVTAIKNAVYTYGPVSTGFYVYDDFFSYTGGCYENTPTPATNHIITIVGWDDTQCDGQGAWIIKNSWGGWGMGGFAYVKYGSSGIGRVTHRLQYTPKMHLLRFVDYAVESGARGDGDGFIDPGETVGLSVTLMNDGKGPATGVSGVLRTSTPGVTVTDSTVTFSDMGPESAGSSAAPHFEIMVGAAFSPGDWIDFELTVTTDTRSAVLEFPVFVGEFDEVLADDFETDQGWLVGAPEDDATAGIWERVVSTQKRWGGWVGEMVQTDRDHTPYPGTYCYVTENSPPGTKQRVGDVDGGRTTLMSPILDLSSDQAAVLRYSRWYSNNTIPTQTDDDPFEVDVSNDGGASWTNLESLTETPFDRRWHDRLFRISDYVALTSQMQVRFVAQDIGPYNSVVEAAVDDVEILAFGGTPTLAGESGADLGKAPGTLFLGQNVPNPFNPETQIPFGLPRDGRVDLSLYNVRGQKVRELVGTWISAGYHVAHWDGRDEAGAAVSPGIYFCRLSSDEGSVTRRMALVK